MISSQLRQRLAQILLRLPAALEPAGRNAWLAGLPLPIIAALNRSPGNAQADIVNLIQQLEAIGPLASGQHPLLIVAENALTQIHGATLGEELAALMVALRAQLQAEPPAPLPLIDASSFNRQLAQALLACSSMSDRSTRNAIIGELPAPIRHQITRHDRADAEVLSIVAACQAHERGLAALLEAVRFFEGGAICLKAVTALIKSGTQAAPQTGEH